jgi:hypothetical protein
MVRLTALALAAIMPLAAAQLRSAPVKDFAAPVKDVVVPIKDVVVPVTDDLAAADNVGVTDPPLPTLPGILVGYVNGGLSESSCFTNYPASTGVCTLQSYQAIAAPAGPLIAYGDRLILQSASYTYYKTQFTSLDPTLQNVSSRNFDLRQDCKLPMYSPTLSYGAFQMRPRGIAKIDEASGNATGVVVPETKDLHLQIFQFNSTYNYSQPNATFFRVFDVDLSHETECHVTESGPSMEKQLAMNLGAGTLRCAVRRDDVDNNATGVVKSTHYALVAHDLTGTGAYATCRGTDSRGYQQSCYRLARVTSYSNGTEGSVLLRDLVNFPTDFQFDSQTPCFYDNNTDAILAVGTNGNYYAEIVRIDSIASMSYTAPQVTTVRTLDKSIAVAQGSLMNIDGNIGIISGSSLLVYSLSGDKLINKTIAVVGSSTSYNPTLQAPVYTPRRSPVLEQ